ncbi:MAG: glycoside hydrolase family 55 protein, partial [Verrucomicrobia bacterium]|nr:glycoside hydrolase family 55 protein [Verrucomicrobiota bacterium]
AGTPPADLQSRHLWPAAFPHRELPGAVSVKDAPYGAKGDGRADDTEPLQRAVNAADVVFLPKGYYRITRPIDLRPGTRLVGAAQHLSILVATGPEGAFADPANPMPIVRSADDAAGDAILANCGLWAPRNLDGASCLHWRSGAKSVVRGVLFLHAPLYATPLKRGEAPAARVTASILVTGHGGGRWYNIFEGGEYPQAPGYRHLLVNGAAGPLSIYQLSPQHVVSDAAVEIRGARNVSFFGMKYEGNSPVVWVRDSDRIRIFGHGGNGKGAEGRSLYRVERTPNFLIANAVEGPTKTGTKTLSGFGTDPGKWFMIAERPAAGPEVHTLPFDRPVLFRRGTPD